MNIIVSEYGAEKFFFDCECEHNFVHFKALPGEDEATCSKCGFGQSEQPDSLPVDVKRFLEEQFQDKYKAVIQAVNAKNPKRMNPHTIRLRAIVYRDGDFHAEYVRNRWPAMRITNGMRKPGHAIVMFHKGKYVGEFWLDEEVNNVTPVFDEHFLSMLGQE